MLKKLNDPHYIIVISFYKPSIVNCEDVSATSVEFTFTNIEYTEVYKNRSSTEFKKIENNIKAMVGRT